MKLYETIAQWILAILTVMAVGMVLYIIAYVLFNLKSVWDLEALL